MMILILILLMMIALFFLHRRNRSTTMVMWADGIDYCSFITATATLSRHTTESAYCSVLLSVVSDDDTRFATRLLPAEVGPGKREMSSSSSPKNAFGAYAERPVSKLQNVYDIYCCLLHNRGGAGGGSCQSVRRAVCLYCCERHEIFFCVFVVCVSASLSRGERQRRTHTYSSKAKDSIFRFLLLEGWHNTYDIFPLSHS